MAWLSSLPAFRILTTGTLARGHAPCRHHETCPNLPSRLQGLSGVYWLSKHCQSWSLQTPASSFLHRSGPKLRLGALDSARHFRAFGIGFDRFRSRSHDGTSLLSRASPCSSPLSAPNCYCNCLPIANCTTRKESQERREQHGRGAAQWTGLVYWGTNQTTAPSGPHLAAIRPANYRSWTPASPPVVSFASVPPSPTDTPISGWLRPTPGPMAHPGGSSDSQKPL